MQVPNSLIVINCADGRAYGPLMLPSYYEKVFRRVYAQRLDPTAPNGGILVSEYPVNGNDDTRYREVFSVAAERASIRSTYKFDKNGFVDTVFTDEELSIAITALLVKEAERLTKAARPAEVITPHKSYLDFGLTPEQAVALQIAGFADCFSCIGASIMDLNNIQGITLDIAAKLIATAPVKAAEVKK